MDFDGVFTDNRALVFEDGREAVFVSRADGMGISRLREANFPMVVISSERNPVVLARCKKLQIECLQAIDDKLPVLMQWTEKNGLSLSEVAYVGNDINDIECLNAAGVGIAPVDAHRLALQAANLVLAAPGGHGAIREISDTILRQPEIE